MYGNERHANVLLQVQGCSCWDFVLLFFLDACKKEKNLFLRRISLNVFCMFFALGVEKSYLKLPLEYKPTDDRPRNYKTSCLSDLKWKVLTRRMTDRNKIHRHVWLPAEISTKNVGSIHCDKFPVVLFYLHSFIPYSCTGQRSE